MTTLQFSIVSKWRFDMAYTATELVDDIIHSASDSNESVSALLRKCLMLAFQLKNDKLKTWVERELNGYKAENEIPAYRKINAVAKGNFIRLDGIVLRNQPLQSFVLDPKDRHFATEIELLQPIAAYAALSPNPEGVPILEWPPDLTVYYQDKFFENYTLNRAWQVIPPSVLVGLVDTVRTRILRFALELKDELDLVSDDPKKLPAAQIERNVVNNIYGGNVVFTTSAQAITQVGQIVVRENDLDGLKRALATLGVAASDVSALVAAIEEDAHEGNPSIGDRTKAWLKALPGKIASGAVTVGSDVAKAAAKQWLLQYFGIDV
jgi:hypothetical protein